MQNHIRAAKLRYLTSQAQYLLKDLKELRQEMSLWYENHAPFKGIYNPHFFNVQYGYSVKEFNSLLKKQNKILKELATINRKKRALRSPRVKNNQLTIS